MKPLGGCTGNQDKAMGTLKNRHNREEMRRTEGRGGEMERKGQRGKGWDREGDGEGEGDGKNEKERKQTPI